MNSIKFYMKNQYSIEEITDEDGFTCEDLDALTQWVLQKFRQVASNADYNLHAVNFAAYGASFVHLDENHKPHYTFI